MKYKITLHNDWTEKYWLSKKPDNTCRRINTESYEVDSLELCIDIVKEFMDAPTSEMTLEDARKDFEDKKVGKLSDETLVSICAYYNGRAKLQKEILTDLKAAKAPCILKYDFPVELNSFTCYPDEQYQKPTQNDAWLQIEIN